MNGVGSANEFILNFHIAVTVSVILITCLAIASAVKASTVTAYFFCTFVSFAAARCEHHQGAQQHWEEKLLCALGWILCVE